MGIFLSYRGIRKTFNIRAALLAFTWISGLIAGAYFVNSGSLSVVSGLKVLLNYSPFGMFLSLFLPLVLSFICLRFFCFYAVLPLVALKSFSFACSIGYITFIFGSAGWLIGGISFFANNLIILLLLIQWFDAATGKRYDRRQYFILFVIIPMLIGLLDYFVVSPFLAMLLNY